MVWSCRILSFKGAPGRDQRIRLYANLLRNGEEVGLVRFKEADECAEQGRLADPIAEVICPDSGQVQEPPRAPFVGQRRSKRRQRNSVCDRLASRPSWPRLINAECG